MNLAVICARRVECERYTQSVVRAQFSAQSATRLLADWASGLKQKHTKKRRLLVVGGGGCVVVVLIFLFDFLYYYFFVGVGVGGGFAEMA